MDKENLFIRLFKKREKTQRWNWILRVGVILFVLSAVCGTASIIMTMLANIDGFKIFGLEANTCSSITAGTACFFAVTAMFFIFCGKTKPAEVKK